MKLFKYLLPFITTVVSFFILYILYFYQTISTYIFWAVTREKPFLVLGSESGFYLFGIFLLSILFGWKISKIQSSKVKNFVTVFGVRITNRFLLIISVLSILISFNSFYFFTNQVVYKTEVLPHLSVDSLKYSDIDSVIVMAYYEPRRGDRSLTSCQLYTNITILSKYFTIEQNPLNFRQIYILGPILTSRNIIPEVSYINSCNYIPEDKKAVIENGFNVKL